MMMFKEVIMKFMEDLLTSRWTPSFWLISLLNTCHVEFIWIFGIFQYPGHSWYLYVKFCHFDNSLLFTTSSSSLPTHRGSERTCISSLHNLPPFFKHEAAQLKVMASNTDFNHFQERKEKVSGWEQGLFKEVFSNLLSLNFFKATCFTVKKFNL